ncbi:creatininase family protein [Roseburia hominis]
MRLENITWPQAETYFQENDMVLLPLGSIESHGRHMPLGTDALIPEHLAKLIEEKSDILIAPSIPYGICQDLTDYPGSISIAPDVYYEFLKQVVENLYLHGARKFVMLNGHGGNVSTIQRVGTEYEKKGCLTAILNWWLIAGELDPKWKGGHGGAEETAAILGINPDLVDKNEIGGNLVLYDLTENIKAKGYQVCDYRGVPITIPRSIRRITDSGWIGPDHPREATTEWGKEMLETTADFLVDFMNEFAKVDWQKKKNEK